MNWTERFNQLIMRIVNSEILAKQEKIVLDEYEKLWQPTKTQPRPCNEATEAVKEEPKPTVNA